MPFCCSGLLVRRRMYADTNVVFEETWKFSNLILSYSFLSICSGISLFGTEYYLLATNMVHLKIDLHPSSPICHGLKKCASFVWGLLLTARAENKYTSPLLVSRFQLNTNRSHGLDWPLLCPTLLLQLFYYRSYFP